MYQYNFTVLLKHILTVTINPVLKVSKEDGLKQYFLLMKNPLLGLSGTVLFIHEISHNCSALHLTTFFMRKGLTTGLLRGIFHIHDHLSFQIDCCHEKMTT